MDMNTLLYRYSVQGMTVALGCVLAALRWWTEPRAAGVIMLAVVAGGLRVWSGLSGLGNTVWAGAVGQDMTWRAYRDPDMAVTNDGTRDEDSELLISQMRRVEERVEAFAGESGMERISLSAAGGRIGTWNAASSVRFGRRGHVTLGHVWLRPERNAVMPYTLEHELAHLRRRDSHARLAAASVGVVLMVLCTGLLPLGRAAAALAGLGVLWVAYLWWSELACDRAAARRCGREMAVASWRQELGDARRVPPVRRLFFAFLALRSHPPLRLRLWLSHLAPPAEDPNSPT
ncbi:hypothetical protein I5Q34_26880 [Streptomyces sp. AV19]|uniref:hypothetical protein n=1 Tax=Streptomyces sp. AV19 TaxID=2793068 RepID=UPI0018FEB3FE|nr:hypothetical protein [Streptomyces sp. AV19]MBH1937852.1 hypothetical protein [Streptomyces sp. AV19]MDG4537130.1 hypothetical protein [Streptomyces sp. AV19]